MRIVVPALLLSLLSLPSCGGFVVANTLSRVTQERRLDGMRHAFEGILLDHIREQRASIEGPLTVTLEPLKKAGLWNNARAWIFPNDPTMSLFAKSLRARRFDERYASQVAEGGRTEDDRWTFENIAAGTYCFAVLRFGDGQQANRWYVSKATVDDEGHATVAKNDLFDASLRCIETELPKLGRKAGTLRR